MKRLWFALISFLLASSKVLADVGGGTGPITFENPLKAKTFTELLGKIIDFLLILAIPISIIMVIYAGFLFMTAGANPDNIEKGRSALLWTALGIVLLMIARSVPYLLQSILGV